MLEAYGSELLSFGTYDVVEGQYSVDGARSDNTERKWAKSGYLERRVSYSGDADSHSPMARILQPPGRNYENRDV